MKIRTQAQALAEAVRRWGKNAAVRKSTCWRGDPVKAAAGDRDHKFYLRIRRCSGLHHPHDCPGGKPLFTIGWVVMGMFVSVKAEGTSWRHAFAVVDWKEHRDHAGLRRRPCCDWGEDRFCDEGLRLLRAAGIERKPEQEARRTADAKAP